MSERTTPSFPPVGDPDRLDAIVRRGRSLRRRRQLGTAGAGVGATLAVVLAVSLVLGGGGGTTDPNLVADDPTSSTSTTTTSTTTPPMPPELTVTVSSGPPATILVEDPAQPAGATTKQCVTVTAFGPLVDGADPADQPVAGEGTQCAAGTSLNGSAVLEVHPATGAEPGGVQIDPGSGPTLIGCAAVIERPPAEDVNSDAVAPVRSSFRISAPELTPGEYRIEVSAVSGLGDGCDPEQPGLERENSTQGTGSIRLP